MTAGLDALFKAQPETLTASEVASLLGITKPGVYQWLKEGIIPGYKLGATWFIIRDDLKATLQAGANTPRGVPQPHPAPSKGQPA
jgi:excisionase family DNA binding protein